MKLLHEAARELSVTGSYDVLVAGGGVAGVAAALAARRCGATVCLVEKNCALGGLATLGNVTIWLPLCDGRGNQVSGGVAEELMRLAVRDLAADNREAGFYGIPACWESGGSEEERRRQRFSAGFNPVSYLMALEELVSGEGVEIRYDTRLCSLARRGETITHAIIEDKGGRSALAAAVFVDATGDADLCHLAGEATEVLDSNVLCGWFYYMVNGVLRLRHCSNKYSPSLTREGAEGPFFRGDDPVAVSTMVQESRKLMAGTLEKLRVELAGAEVEIFTIPVIPCFRATRRYAGGYTIVEEEAHKWHHDTCGMVSDWRKAGPVWAVPWRSLCASGAGNLAVAGRCVAAAGGAWDVLRALPGCAVTGEAAGTAAALVAAGGGDLRKLDAGVLQARLRARGVILGREKLGRSGLSNNDGIA
ncbi:MAG: FAD-dependent oxidoreductase [Lentisphaerae bacterium]|nr:FAD-dependent oxidoreductase [Lentisphaerota bacterium]